jgi:hypothetical protein
MQVKPPVHGGGRETAPDGWHEAVVSRDVRQRSLSPLREALYCIERNEQKLPNLIAEILKVNRWLRTWHAILQRKLAGRPRHHALGYSDVTREHLLDNDGKF